MMEHLGDKGYLKSLAQKNINRIPVKKDLIIPSQRLIIYLEERYKRTVIDQKDYEISIPFRRKGENHTVIMAIPEWFTICQLYKITGFHLGMDINAHWINNCEYVISSGMHNTISFFYQKKNTCS